MQEWDALMARAKREGSLVIVDCYARWCGPCRRAAPVFAALSDSYVGVIFVKVDVDVAKDVACHLEIEALPTFLLIKDGKVYFKFKGFSEHALHDILLKAGALPATHPARGRLEEPLEEQCLLAEKDAM